MAAKRKPSTNPVELERTLEAMRIQGLLEEIDSAHVQMLRSLAAACEAQPGKAALWREYRETLREVRGGGDDEDDEFSASLAAITGATPMGDSPEA